MKKNFPFPLLLKPYILGSINELKQEYKSSIWNRTTFAILFLSFILFGMYLVGGSFFIKFKEHEVFSVALIESFISFSLLALFTITCFSGIISSMGALFSSKDLSLFFVAPISLNRIFISKFIYICLLSSWMFALVTIAFGLGLIQAFDISWTVIPYWGLNFILFLTIPTSLGIIIVIAIANIVPAERLREVIVLTVILGLIAVLSFDHETTLSTGNTNSITKAMLLSKKFSSSHHELLPNGLLASVISNDLSEKSKNFRPMLFLSGYSIISIIFTLIAFRFLFLRGWAKSTNSNVQRIMYKSQLSKKIGDYFFHNPSPLRAFLGKEIRTFIRDTTQSIQLLLLLTLTFIYIYNFRVIQSGALIEEQYMTLWETILYISNILFGGFVIAAICTRFVFPTISLEGQSYQIIRASPVSIKNFIKFKFLTWYFPISFISFVLLVSGGIAIEGDKWIFIANAIISICLSASLVALGIGTGSIYSRFNWENPIQVSSNFGSLVYMILSMGVIFINLIPTSITFIFLNFEFLQNSLLWLDLTFVYLCCLFLIISINGVIIKKSLLAAENHLKQNEKV